MEILPYFTFTINRYNLMDYIRFFKQNAPRARKQLTV